jgi:regulator of RNase E activity RraA
VSDALQQAGVGAAISGITAYSDMTVIGEAFTVRLCEPGQSERPFNAYLDEVPPEAVIVVDFGGRHGISVFGGLMAAEALRRGASGAVVNGDVRDAAEAREIGFGLFALGLTPRSGRLDARLRSTNEPLEWEGVRVEPGDTIVADEDGVVVVPARHAAEVLERAALIEATDADLRTQIATGVPLAVALAKLGRDPELSDVLGGSPNVTGGQAASTRGRATR